MKNHEEPKDLEKSGKTIEEAFADKYADIEATLQKKGDKAPFDGNIYSVVILCSQRILRDINHCP